MLIHQLRVGGRERRTRVGGVEPQRQQAWHRVVNVLGPELQRKRVIVDHASNVRWHERRLLRFVRSPPCRRPRRRNGGIGCRILVERDQLSLKHLVVVLAECKIARLHTSHNHHDHHHDDDHRQYDLLAKMHSRPGGDKNVQCRVFLQQLLVAAVEAVVELDHLLGRALACLVSQLAEHQLHSRKQCHVALVARFHHRLGLAIECLDCPTNVALLGVELGTFEYRHRRIHGATTAAQEPE